MTAAKPTARLSKTPGKTDTQVSVVDQMAEDAEAVTAPPEFPAGAPDLKPLLAIRPRSRRAEFKRRYAEIAEQKPGMEVAQKAAAKLKQGSDERYAAELRLWAQMDDFYDKVDAALRLAAIDPDAYAAWSDAVSDEDLAQTFSAYQARTQPGEAPSSTS